MKEKLSDFPFCVSIGISCVRDQISCGYRVCFYHIIARYLPGNKVCILWPIDIEVLGELLIEALVGQQSAK